MNKLLPLAICSLFLGNATLHAKPSYWNQFRGSNGDGDAGDAILPLVFNEGHPNITWKTPVTGKAWSSPVIRDGMVWLTNALLDGQKMWAVCLDFETGKMLHETLVFENGKPQFCHNMNSYATPTPVIEGGRVFVHFGTHGTAALDAKTGKKLWERRDFKCNHHRGAAASPIPFEKSLIVHFDGFDLQYVVSLSQDTGETLWRKNRAFDFGTNNGDNKKAYCTPSVIKHKDRLELISPAAAATESRNPRTGELFWTARTGGMNSSSRPIYRDGLVYVFNGMGSISAIKPGGTGDVDKTHMAWARRKVVAKKSSPLLLDGLLYMTSDEGVASCSNPQTGEIIWAERLGGKGQYAASPIHANGHIYFSSSEGDFPVLKAGRKFEIISRNKLDAGCMASPAIVGNALVIRTKTHVYRIEKSS